MNGSNSILADMAGLPLGELLHDDRRSMLTGLGSGQARTISLEFRRAAFRPRSESERGPPMSPVG